MSDESERNGAEPARLRARALGLNSTAVLLISIAIQLIGYVPTFFLARGLGLSEPGQELIGTIQLFLLIATSITNIGDLRIGAAYTFFVSRGQPPRTSTTTYLLIRLVLVSAAGLTLWVLAPDLDISQASVFEILAVWMVLPILWSLSTVYQQVWIALGDSLRSQLPLFVESVVRAGALTYVALRLVHVATPTGTLWAMTDAYLAGAIASSLLSIPTLVRHWGRFDRIQARAMFTWAWPLMGSLVLLYLSGNLIQFVVVAFLGRAPYNRFMAANAFRILALAIPAAIAIPLFPHISGLHKDEQFEAIRTRTWQSLRYTAMLVVPGVLALVVYRENFLNVFYAAPYAVGPTNVQTPLAILAVSAVPAALSQIIGTTLTSTGQQRLELYITSLQVACLAVAAWVLVRPGAVGLPQATSLNALGLTGSNGAAIAVLVSSMAALLLNIYFMESLLGVRIQLRPIGMITLSSAVSFFAISRLNRLLPVNRWYQLLLAVAVALVVYGLVLAALGELTKEDVRQLTSSLGLPPWFGALLARICWRVQAPPVNRMPPRGAGALVATAQSTPPPDSPATEEEPGPPRLR